MDLMARAHSAASNYKKLLPNLIAETDLVISSANCCPSLVMWLKQIGNHARESGADQRAGYQLLCVLEVLLQELAHGRVTALNQCAAPASRNHAKSMRGRKCRLGDLLPFSGLAVRDGLTLRTRLEAVLCVQVKHFHNKLQELGLCPPGPPEHWGRGGRSAWQLAWGAMGGQFVLLHSRA
jgi:hypothetical protein